MSDFGFPSGHTRYEVLTGGTATASGSTNTKGSYTELHASTAFDACGLWISFSCQDSTRALWLYDIAIGAAASEQIIIPNAVVGSAETTSLSIYSPLVYFPVFIPAGTRISARVQANAASKTLTFGGVVCAAPFMGVAGLGRVTTYGADTATSGGTAVTLPSSGNGSYAQLTSSTTNDIKAAIIEVAYYGASASYAGSLEFSVGAGGSEQVVFKYSILFRSTGHSFGVGPLSSGLIPMNIPAGSRLACRFVFVGGSVPSGVSVLVHGVD